MRFLESNKIRFEERLVHFLESKHRIFFIYVYDHVFGLNKIIQQDYLLV